MENTKVKSWKVLISFGMSILLMLSVRPHVSTRPHWTDFHGIWYWKLLLKVCQGNQNLVEMGWNTGKLIWRPKYIGLYIFESSTKYFVTAQREGAHCCLSMTTLKKFYIADRGMWVNNTKGSHCWIFMTITVTRNRNNGVLCIHCPS